MSNSESQKCSKEDFHHCPDGPQHVSLNLKPNIFQRKYWSKATELGGLKDTKLDINLVAYNLKGKGPTPQFHIHVERALKNFQKMNFLNLFVLLLSSKKHISLKEF